MILVIQLVLFLLQCKTKSTQSVKISLPGCPDSCGGVPVPYPFGIGENCSMSVGFNLSCRNRINKGTSSQYLSYDKHFDEILNISLSSGQALANYPISSQCYNSTTKRDNFELWLYSDSTASPFWVNNDKNIFMVTGCNTLAYLRLDRKNYSVGCLATCDSRESLNMYGMNCSGIGCCETGIPKATQYFVIEFDKRYNNSDVYNISPCSYAMVMVNTGSMYNISYTTDEMVLEPQPMVLDWAVGNTTCEEAQSNKTSYACKSDHSVCLNSSTGVGYICNCFDGYDGNPYLERGCQDIDECATENRCSKPAKCQNLPGQYRCYCPFGWRRKDDATCELNMYLIIGSCAGIVALLLLGFAIYVIIERRNLSKVKEKYFQQHGGWILLENIKSNQGLSFTIFTKQQIEQATNNFEDANIIGHGGQGTVYKGTLKGQTVAIKKCKIVDENKKKEFGKEMYILSQINHKNIVKLLGCCLEVEVPILVYEFIPNSTLFHYIHEKVPRSPTSFTMRLRIAHESAEALAYLHTSASPPIFHGDVKSSNILLDHNYTAKVSDFGASILAPTDEEQFVTIVQGTCGYLDPEYMQSCQLTDKSDVYSFGVVLIELLTSKLAIDFDAPEEERSLSARFLSATNENKLQDLLDNEIKNENNIESIMEVAELAMKCLSMKGEDRPLMKEVAEELCRIIKLDQHSWGQELNPQETTTLLSGESHHDREIEHSSYYFNADKRTQETIAIGR